jgi:glycosyltransferase involved in cell wall biosynthesis
MSVISRQDPLISILLPVFNAERTLGEAIDSILNQSFLNFELLILLDGCTDESKIISLLYKDPRIKIIESSNVGLVEILNLGISHAKGKYIARQDADDISMPNRLEVQVTIMESSNEIGMLGSWAQIFSDKNNAERFHRHPKTHNAITLFLLFDNPFVHSSIMIRGDVIKSFGGYSALFSRNPPEDYDLWVKVSRQFLCLNIPVSLVRYREVEDSISLKNRNLVKENVINISSLNIYNFFNEKISLADSRLLSQIYHHQIPNGVKVLRLWAVMFKFITAIFPPKIIKNTESSFIFIKINIQLIKNIIHKWLVKQ